MKRKRKYVMSKNKKSCKKKKKKRKEKRRLIAAKTNYLNDFKKAQQGKADAKELCGRLQELNASFEKNNNKQ